MAYKGALTFGLVYIPVTLDVTVKNNDIGFNLLDKNTMSRIKYKKTCVDCDNKEVKNENIVKGYRYEKDKYVIFTDEDFEKLKSKKDKNIVIEQFVDLKEVDPIYFDKSYFVSPSSGERAFNVLLSAMEKQKKAGIARAVLGTKESLFLIWVQSGVMMASTLYFYDEIQKKPEIKKVKIDTSELKLATTLIEQMTKKFDIEKYKDEYTEKVKKAIKQKIAGKEIAKVKETFVPENVVDLMEALKKSLSHDSIKDKTTRKVKHG